MSEPDPLNPGKYLGEFDPPPGHKYADFTPSDWAMYFVERCGQIDGDHHKAWVIDQVARCLKGCPVKVVEARWSSGYAELRCWIEETSEEYQAWRQEMLGEYDEENEEYEYDYDEGIAP